jgi:transcription elongation factor Elf1
MMAPVRVSKYGRTFDCFKASHTMQSTAAIATQQSVAMNCGPANHYMTPHAGLHAGRVAHGVQ